MGVARIDDAYIPDDEELNWVLDQTRSKGWLETMRQDLINLGISDAPLINPKVVSDRQHPLFAGKRCVLSTDVALCPSKSYHCYLPLSASPLG